MTVGGSVLEDVGTVLEDTRATVLDTGCHVLSAKVAPGEFGACEDVASLHWSGDALSLCGYFSAGVASDSSVSLMTCADALTASDRSGAVEACCWSWSGEGDAVVTEGRSAVLCAVRVSDVDDCVCEWALGIGCRIPVRGAECSAVGHSIDAGGGGLMVVSHVLGGGVLTVLAGGTYGFGVVVSGVSDVSSGESVCRCVPDGSEC